MLSTEHILVKTEASKIVPFTLDHTGTVCIRAQLRTENPPHPCVTTEHLRKELQYRIWAHVYGDLVVPISELAQLAMIRSVEKQLPATQIDRAVELTKTLSELLSRP